MKIRRIIFLTVLLMASTIAFAKATPEERAARDYSTWLPAQGDWGIGFSLDPITTFVGNMFNGYGTSGDKNILGDLGGQSMSAFAKPVVSIMGTYMVKNDLGLRANVGLVLNYDNNKAYVVDDAAVFTNPLSLDKVIDGQTLLTTGGSVSFGVEYHLGKKLPIQGIFGGGLMYEFHTTQSTYTYGNAISQVNQNPSHAYDEISGGVQYYTEGGRLLKNYNGEMNHTVALYGTVGFEWFVAPKIALGANVNLLLAYTIKGQQYQDVEGWNTVTDNYETCTNLVTPRQGSLTFSTNNIGANLYMVFYLK